jgi:hypothetical protein
MVGAGTGPPPAASSVSVLRPHRYSLGARRRTIHPERTIDGSCIGTGPSKALGPAAEANPIVAFLFGSYGYPTVAIAKVVLLAFTTAVAALLIGVRPRPRLAATVVAVGILVGLVGGVSNWMALGSTLPAGFRTRSRSGPSDRPLSGPGLPERAIRGCN